MRIEVMKYFLEIADAKSISKISRKYIIPQQSLSSMLSSLENELGITLFFHSGHGMSLTEEGREFYQYCVQFYKEYRKLEITLHPETKKVVQIIDIVSQNNIAQTILPHWISLLSRYQPNIKLNVEIKSATEVIEEVLSGEKQIGFLLCFEKNGVKYPSIPDELVFIPCFSSRPYFWLNKSNFLFKEKFLTLEMVNHYPIIRDENTDGKLFDYIMREHFQLESDIISAANAHIIRQLLKDDYAICPDLKAENGILGMSYLFDGCEELEARPLSMKGNYKFVTGYVMDETVKESGLLDSVLSYLDF